MDSGLLDVHYFKNKSINVYEWIINIKQTKAHIYTRFYVLNQKRLRSINISVSNPKFPLNLLWLLLYKWLFKQLHLVIQQQALFDSPLIQVLNTDISSIGLYTDYSQD